MVNVVDVHQVFPVGLTFCHPGARCANLLTLTWLPIWLYIEVTLVVSICKSSKHAGFEFCQSRS